MDSIVELKDKWKQICETIDELAEERRKIRKKIKEMNLSLPIRDSQNHPPKNKERDEQVIALFKEGKTLQEIGDEMGFTREYARQILKKHGLSGKDGGSSVKEKQKTLLSRWLLNRRSFLVRLLS